MSTIDPNEANRPEVRDLVNQILLLSLKTGVTHVTIDPSNGKLCMSFPTEGESAEQFSRILRDMITRLQLMAKLYSITDTPQEGHIELMPEQGAVYLTLQTEPIENRHTKARLLIAY